MAAPLQQLVDWFEIAARHPDEGAGSLARNRRRLVAAYAGVLAVVTAISAPCYYLIGAPWIAFNTVTFGATCTGAFIALLRGRSEVGAARLITATLWLEFAFTLGASGGTSSAFAQTILLIPFTAAVLGGMMSALCWGLASIGLIVALGTAEQLGRLPVPFMLTGLDFPVMRTAVISFVILIVLGVAFIQEQIHIRATRVADQARIVAEHANELKSHFLLSVSHELLTPLNGVLGLSEVLQDTKVDAEQAELVHGVRQSGQSLLRLLQDLLDFSEVQARVATVHTEAVDVRSIVEDTLETYRPAAQEKRLSLQLSDTCYSGPIVGDKQRLQRCLSLLVDNAIKFTDTGCVTIRVVREGHHLRWSVKDSGRGIAPEARRQIFESFRQLEGGTTRTAGGLGLGLAHWVAQVELMGGSFGLESTLGQGSTFWFELPIGATTLSEAA